MNKNRFVWLLIALLFLFGCADPRLEAEAEATRLRAEQDAADRAQQRQQDAEWWQIRKTEMQETSNAWVNAWSGFLSVSMGAFSLGAAIVLLSLAIGTAITFVGIGRANYQAAWLRANQIVLDPETGQYPLFLQRVGPGLYTLTDPNTGMVLNLHMGKQPDRQMVAAAYATRLNGVTARQARLAGPNAEGVAMIGTQPVIVTGGGDGQ